MRGWPSPTTTRSGRGSTAPVGPGPATTSSNAPRGGHTGVVATLSQGEGPCIGLRVDLDAISIHESAEPDHRPTAEGFRSEHDGYMHACGHDAHLAIALGTLEAVKQPL